MPGSPTLLRPGDRERTGGLRCDVPEPDRLPKPGRSMIRELPWVRTQQISTHWIRHTTLTWVERNFGYAVARAYAGHTDASGDVGATSTYVRASLSEVAAALAALTGEPHPLATAEGW